MTLQSSGLGKRGPTTHPKYWVVKIIANDTALSTGDNLNNNRFVSGSFASSLADNFIINIILKFNS